MKNTILDLVGSNMITLDIGSKNIKIIEGRLAGNKIFINKGFLIPTPEDSFYNGEITNIRKIKEAIDEAIQKEGIRTKKMILTIEGIHTINREILLPKAKPKEIKQILDFEVEQYFPISLDEYIIQYKLLEGFEEKGLQKNNILVAALPKAIAEKYLALVKEMGYEPVALDLHFNCLHKLFQPKTSINGAYILEDETIAILDLGHQFINVTIISNGQFKFSRLLNNGGKEIDINIANYFNLSLQEGEGKKREIKNINQSADHAPTDMLIKAVRMTVDYWLEEIERIFKFYTSRNLGNMVDIIYLCGGGAQIEGLSIYIQEFFNIPTLEVNSLSNIKFKDDSTILNFPQYINAIGAMIRK